MHDPLGPPIAPSVPPSPAPSTRTSRRSATSRPRCCPADLAATRGIRRTSAGRARRCRLRDRGVRCRSTTPCRSSGSRRDGDADRREAGARRCTGPLASILTAERTALNFLGHLSGIATRHAAFVDAAAAEGPPASGTPARPRRVCGRWRRPRSVPVAASTIAATCRDWILLKDNHLALLGIDDAVARPDERWPARTVHVECDTPRPGRARRSRPAPTRCSSTT